MGAGLIGREHMKLVAAHAEAELVAIADVSPEAEATAAGQSVPLYADFERMLDELAPDGAIVALPNELHAPAGLACVEHGIPALIEKPVAHTVAAALELVERGEAAGVPLMVGHHRRHSPDMREAHRAILAGELGDVVAVSGLCLVAKHDSYFDHEWRRRPGGGPLLINAIHDVDCLRFLCGEMATVQAIASSAVRGFEVEDTVAVTMRFTSGALGTFLISDAVPSPWFWDIASGQARYFPVPERAADSYVVGGRKGSLAVPSLDLWTHEPGGDWRDPIMPSRLAIAVSRCYENQLHNFVAVVRGEAEPVVTARDATMTLAATLAIGRAAVEGRAVDVAEMLS